MTPKNTYYQTTVRGVVFHEKGTWYGVALEFNIVVDGDSPEVVMDSLSQAIRNYFEAAKKNKLDVRVLNQKTEPEYEAMWTAVETRRQDKKPTRSTFEKVYGSFSIRPAMMA